MWDRLRSPMSRTFRNILTLLSYPSGCRKGTDSLSTQGRSCRPAPFHTLNSGKFAILSLVASMPVGSAVFFAVPLNRLAKSLDVDAPTVYKTPDTLQHCRHACNSMSVSPSRSWSVACGFRRGLRIWLNTPEPDLDNDEVPRDLILNGEGEAGSRTSGGYARGASRLMLPADELEILLNSGGIPSARCRRTFSPAVLSKESSTAWGNHVPFASPIPLYSRSSSVRAWSAGLPPKGWAGHPLHGGRPYHRLHGSGSCV